MLVFVFLTGIILNVGAKLENQTVKRYGWLLRSPKVKNKKYRKLKDTECYGTLVMSVMFAFYLNQHTHIVCVCV
jgi:hypothetical protein